MKNKSRIISLILFNTAFLCLACIALCQMDAVNTSPKILEPITEQRAIEDESNATFSDAIAVHQGFQYTYQDGGD